MAVCAYHPDRTAVGRCTECQRDLCADCKNEVGGKLVCAHCAEVIRSKVGAEMSAGSQPAASAGVGASYPQGAAVGASSASSPYGAAPATLGEMPNPIVQEPPSPGRLLVGIVLGALFGAVGAFIWKTVAYYAHFELAYLNIIVGCAAGYGVVMGSGRHGILPAILGAVLGFAAMMFGYYLLMSAQYHDAAREVLSKLAAAAGGKAPAGLDIPPFTFQEFVEGLKELNVLDWAFVAAGVYGGFIIGMKTNPKLQA